MQTGSLNRIKGCQTYRGALHQGVNRKIYGTNSGGRGLQSFESYRIRILFFCGKLDLKPHLTRSIQRRTGFGPVILPLAFPTPVTISVTDNVELTPAFV